MGSRQRLFRFIYRNEFILVVKATYIEEAYKKAANGRWEKVLPYGDGVIWPCFLVPEEEEDKRCLESYLETHTARR